MKIGFIGTGKVSYNMGKYLKNNGANISGYLGRTPEDSKNASEFMNTQAFFSYEEILEKSDVILLTIPDQKIEIVWQEIKSKIKKDIIIAHTSGSISSKVFNLDSNSNLYGYSIHPLFPFANKYLKEPNLQGIYLSIEGDERKKEVLKVFFEKFGFNVIFRKESNSYHLANVISSNLILALLKISLDYMKESGIDYNEALKALKPLIYKNIDNIYEKGFEKSLTGPIERADFLTLLNHKKALKKEHYGIYKTLSYELLNIAILKKSKDVYCEITKFLDEFESEAKNDFKY